MKLTQNARTIPFQLGPDLCFIINSKAVTAFQQLVQKFRVLVFIRINFLQFNRYSLLFPFPHLL